MAHQELALHAIMKGIDKIPDKVWDFIPGHKEKKEETSSKEDRVESKRQRRRDSETSKYRNSRDLHRSDEYNRDRRERRQRAKTESPESSDLDDDLVYSRGRDKRTRNYNDKYGGDYDYKRRSGDYANERPSSYVEGASMPHPLYHPASYPTAPYGQPVPFAYAAVHPINPQAPYQPQSYAHPQSAGSSRSASNAPPIWSGDTSRRSSIYSNNNYTPPTNPSPPKQSFAPPPPQAAYQTHPAYTNGAPPSTAASRYTPTTNDQASAAQASANQASQQVPAIPLPHIPSQYPAARAPSQPPSTFQTQHPAAAASRAGSAAIPQPAAFPPPTRGATFPHQG